MPIMRLITADRGDAGRRLDLVLQRHLGDVTAASRSRIQQWISEGRVSLNEAPVRRASARTAQGDVVRVTLPDEVRRTPMAAEELPLQIVYEDHDLLAVNKPAGMVAHPTFRHPHGTLMNALLWHARAWPADRRPSLVGRLDRLTSGVLIVAKTRSIHAALQRTLASARSEKQYLAVVYGRVAPEHGSIDLALSRDEHDRRMVVTSDVGGRPSHTVFERLGWVPAPRIGLSLLCCRLVTGRMHQIRVHLAARGWPVVGDAKYGRPLWARVNDAVLSSALKAFPRQALHAWRVRLEHPVTRQHISCEASPPDDFQRLLEAARLPATFYSRSDMAP